MTSFPLRSGLVAITIAIASAAISCSSGKTEPRATATVPAPVTTTPVREDAGVSADNGAEGALASKESKAVAKTLARVSELRGIRATRPVPGVKLERDQLVGRVKDKALREYPKEALQREGQLLQLMGFAPTTFDYLNEMMKLLESQLEGFYEPNNGTMYLAADLRGKEAQATLAHELVHALQDQSYDLKSRSSYRPGKGDETLALACLAEGDATSLMMDFVLREQNRTALDLPAPMLREMMEGGMNGASVKDVPHILRSTLIAPYIDGLDFVHALRRKGGWNGVDEAWRRTPTSTEQILHVEKWEQRERPIAIEPPTAQALGAGWKLDDEDTFGELGFALTYEEWLPSADARLAARDWGGDRSAIYVKGDEIAFAVHTRYDDASSGGAKAKADAYATRGMAKLAQGLKKSLAVKPSIDTSDAICFERKELGPLLIARRERDLVLIAGPAKNNAPSNAWSSTSTCAQAKRWADEIAR